MKLYNSNAQIINSNFFSIHDDYFIVCSFEPDTAQIKLTLQKYEKIDEYYLIKYNNVVGLYMTSCEFWGKSSRVLDFEYVKPEESKLLKDLSKIQNDMSCLPDSDCKLFDEGKFFETVITLISGDKIIVLCESIDIER